MHLTKKHYLYSIKPCIAFICNCNHKERKFPCKVVYLQILQTQMIDSERNKRLDFCICNSSRHNTKRKRVLVINMNAVCTLLVLSDQSIFYQSRFLWLSRSDRLSCSEHFSAQLAGIDTNSSQWSFLFCTFVVWSVGAYVFLLKTYMARLF